MDTQIDQLFLIRNLKEYRRASALVQANPLRLSVILEYIQKPPYLVDNHTNLPTVYSWRDFGVSDPELNRYWLEQYPAIHRCVSNRVRGLTNDPLSQTPHFLLGLIWDIGDSYLKYFAIVRDFFERHSPRITYLRPKTDFPGRLFLSCISRFKIEHRRL